LEITAVAANLPCATMNAVFRPEGHAAAAPPLSRGTLDRFFDD
jgi:hypothetical protein